MTSSDRFPVPVRSAVKSNFTNWRCQNLSKRALNALTSTTELDKLFQIFTMRAEKNAFVSHNERYDFAIYSGCLWCLLRYTFECFIYMLYYTIYVRLMAVLRLATS